MNTKRKSQYQPSLFSSLQTADDPVETGEDSDDITSPAM